MADTGYLKDDTRGARRCWQIGGTDYGANVGDGPSVRDIQAAFEKSPPHMSNIVDRAFVVMGLGSARGHGVRWFVQEFCGFSGTTRTVRVTAPIDLH